MRLADQEFSNVNKLRHKKSLLITRAISWVLRSLIIHHPVVVKNYLEANKDALPKIAVREASRKLQDRVKGSVVFVAEILKK